MPSFTRKAANGYHAEFILVLRVLKMRLISLLQNTISSQTRLLEELSIAKYYKEKSELNRLFMQAKNRTAAEEGLTFFSDPWEFYH